ncbi:DUF488 family protein, N3 subclade [Halobaculum sp. P14]|uniref:DUF488 family protein, N3 subclade n=1 Tax=Halobaculum sp. P14 TaxID=3421638 RepID=UPI003EBFA148
MTVRTTYFGGLGSVVEPAEDELVLGVVRYPQEFVEDVVDRNVPALAPPPSLLDAYKTVESAAERDGADDPAATAWNSVDFEERYRGFIENPGQQQVLSNLREQAADGTGVWLVCWEKDATHCHRRLLAEILAESAGVDIEHRPHPNTLERTKEDDEPEPTAIDDFGGDGR